MADRVKKVGYAYVMVPNRAGQGVAILAQLRQAKVNLIAFSAFPGRGGKAQVDLITEDLSGVRRVAQRNGWRLSQIKRGFVIQGRDRVGGVSQHLAKLAGRRINVTAVDAVAAGWRRYGMILWVKQKDYARAARALGAR
jgi:hypothetical protein